MSSSVQGIRVVVDPSIKVRENLKENWKREIDFGSSTAMKGTHGLLSACHQSFCVEAPLVLKPDHILITVIQSLALCIRQEPEKFAASMGAFENVSKRKIKVYVDNPCDWNRAFDLVRIALGESFGTHVTEQAACDFSTSCFATKNVANICLMDAYSPFAQYQVISMCGIPVVHLLGTEADWQKVLTKVQRLSIVFNSLDWWFKELIPVIKQMRSLWSGTVDVGFWRSFYKYESSSGSCWVSGSINAFFPYVTKYNGNTQEQNTWFQNKKGNEFIQFPPMSSSVPFLFSTASGDEQMTANASFTGTRVVFNNSFTPVCEWQVKDSKNKVVSSGCEPILGVTAGAKPVNAQPLQAAVASSTSSQKPEASVESVVTAISKATSITKVLLPCWHLIKDVPATEEFKAPDLCPECNVTVDKAIDSY